MRASFEDMERDNLQDRDQTRPTVERSTPDVHRGTGRLLADGGDPEDGEAESESDESSGEETDAEASEQEDEATAEDTAANGDAPTDGEADGETQVLFLDLEGLSLDLLGLEVDLDEVVLDVSAATGDGNLVGNLLSAVAGLLDGPSLDLLGGEGLLGGLMGSGEGEGDEESPLSSAGGEAKSAMSDAFDELPVDELLSQLAAEVVRQLLGDSSNGESATDEGETAEASG